MQNFRHLDLSDLSPAAQQRVRRVFALGGIRGGDGDDPLDLDTLLARAENLDDLTDADLGTLVDDLTAAGDLLLEGERSDDALAGVLRAADARDTVLTAIESRMTRAAELNDQAAELTARLHPELANGPEPDPDAPDGGDPDAPPADPAVTAATDPPVNPAEPAPTAADLALEPVAASAAPAPAPARVAARRPAASRPVARPVEVDRRLVLRASSNISSMAPGALLDTPERIGEAFFDVARHTASHRGGYQQFPICSLGVADASEIYGEDRTLRHNARDNEPRIESLTGLPALRASGGICAPTPVQYDLPIMGTNARPVREALARFGADRGGVRLLPPPLLSDLDGAIGIWTEENDQNPSDPSVKPCLVLDCPDDVETIVDAITSCLRIGNFRARYFPEQVAAWVTKAAQNFARVAESRILTKIGAESTQVKTGQVLGTTRHVLTVLDRAGAALRSRHRLDPDYPLRMIAPAWLLDNMRSDLTRQMPGDNMLDTTDAQINAFLASRQINVAWTLDGEAGQIFGTQHDGDLLGWPSTVIVYLYPEGSWLYLDGGTLDFGLVRDSVLNSTNDFQLFSEGFENVAFHGYESQRIVMDVCPSGEAAALADTSGICATGS